MYEADLYLHCIIHVTNIFVSIYIFIIKDLLYAVLSVICSWRAICHAGDLPGRTSPPRTTQVYLPQCCCIPASRTNVSWCQIWQIPYQNLDRDTYIKCGIPLWMLTIMYQFYYKIVVGIIIKNSNNDFLLSNKFE